MNIDGMAAYLRAVASKQPWNGITPDLIEVARWAISEHERAEKLTRKPLQPPSPYYLGLCRHLRIDPSNKRAQTLVLRSLDGLVNQSTVWSWAHGRTPRATTREEIEFIIGYRFGGEG